MSRNEALEYEYDYGRCCPVVTYEGCEREYIINLLASLSRHDRIWTMKQIIQKAPEFGVCRNLGANIFNYFVLFDLKDIDAIMCVLLEEIIATPLQYFFEYAISMAIADYQCIEGVPSLRLYKAREYGRKLIRTDLDLARLCNN